MNYLRTMSCLLAFTFVATSAHFASNAHAATIAADSFLTGNNPAAGEYAHDASLDNGTTANPAITNFNAAWNSGGTNLWRSVNTGLDHPSVLGEAGGSVRFNWTGDVGERNVKRNLTSPPSISTGDTFWMAGLVQLIGDQNANGATNFNGFAYGGFSSELTGNNSQGLRFGVEGDGSEYDLVTHHRTNNNASISTVVMDGISPGDTHLVLMRVTVNTDLGGGGVLGNDNVSVWVDPNDVSSVAALGAATVSYEDFSTWNNQAFRCMGFRGSNITNGGVLFDELALGRELGDVVTAAPNAVPEPTTGILMLLGIGGLAIQRCRRSAA